MPKGLRAFGGRGDEFQPRSLGKSFWKSRGGGWALEEGVTFTGSMWGTRDPRPRWDQLRARQRGC